MDKITPRAKTRPRGIVLFIKQNAAKFSAVDNFFKPMTRQLLIPVLLSLVTSFLTTTSTHAQSVNVSARQGISAISARYGPASVQWLAEIRGRSGIPQPNSWEILAYNDRSTGLLHRFWAGGGRVGDAGADNTRYPVNIPVGYFGAAQVVVDSVAAFTIAEGEARKARIAFDSCDYLLRVREYSAEPIWRLELLDPTQRLVGKIYLSASNGEVLRTVWMYYNGNAPPKIADSLAPSLPPATTSSTQVPNDSNPIGEPGLSNNADLNAPTVPSATIAPPAGFAPIPSRGIADNSIPSPSFPPANGRNNFPPVTATPAAPAPLPNRSERRYNDTGIPEPPAIANGSGSMPDLRDSNGSESEEPKPPVEVPNSSGSTDRIPPPPIPNS
ncbi:MAG: hypothetical protein CMO61_09155 [Verrucomicrobiales bacterium]|nr:hypothetical protein [Verrucomicrobiales bacterium]